MAKCTWDKVEDWKPFEISGELPISYVHKSELGPESLFALTSVEDIVRVNFGEGIDHDQVAEDLRNFINEGGGIEK